MATEGSVKEFMYSLRCLPPLMARRTTLSFGQSWMTTSSRVRPLSRNTPRPSSENSAPPTKTGVPSGREKILLHGTLPSAGAPVSGLLGLGNEVDAHVAKVCRHGKPAVGEPDAVVALDGLERAEEAVVSRGRRVLPADDARRRRGIVRDGGDGGAEAPPLAAREEGAEGRYDRVEQDRNADDENEVSGHGACID